MLGHINLRFIKIKINMITIFMGTVYLTLLYILVHAWFLHKHKTMTMRTLGVNLSKVVVHIDLKGSPPKLTYLTSLLPLFKDLGVNALLMEYEDMFPYKGKLTNLSSKYCYKEYELKEFIRSAGSMGLEIIPLLQTFGHMEHALKLSEFKHLREESLYPDSICPSKIESRALINSMLKQVIRFHKGVTPLKHIHIGCDEVFHINKCVHCRRQKQTDVVIYINHLRKITDYVKYLSPKTTVLIWDDMLRSMKSDDWDSILFLNGIEPVYWDYSPSLRVSHRNLYKYHKKFGSIWIASAFKGAEGRTATLPGLENRFVNHVEWLKLIRHYKFGGERKTYAFKGIILTGWSRYSHMDPLCELLPASIPSLILNLLLIKHFQEGFIDGAYSMERSQLYYKYLKNDYNRYLQCEDDVTLEDFYSSTCKFKENKVYNTLEQYVFQTNEIIMRINDVKEELNSLEYYYKLDHLNMNTILPTIKWCNETLLDYIDLENRIVKELNKYYEVFVINEYVNYKTYYAKRKLRELLRLLENYYNIRTWHREPHKTHRHIGGY